MIVCEFACRSGVTLIINISRRLVLSITSCSSGHPTIKAWGLFLTLLLLSVHLESTFLYTVHLALSIIPILSIYIYLCVCVWLH
ncbi:unnamed protein product [Phytomonas sp. EM1]|nr:unnamed protein product [Phytomonas sp. EM1]|eukprot:CCW64256.1 unnamed protein product [Phytomonas sp. isolate EM1]